MAYTRLNLSDGQVFNASHVSHIEDGIEDCETQLSEVNQSLTDINIFQLGTAISSGTDMNDYTKTGKYYCSSSSIAETLTNAPVENTGFGLLVLYTISTNRYIQIAFINRNTTPLIMARTCPSNGWGEWLTVV